VKRPEVELLPHEWKSDREKSREPFFGEGAWGAGAYAIGWLVTFSFIYFALHH
jgi:hypothetical protein